MIADVILARMAAARNRGFLARRAFLKMDPGSVKGNSCDTSVKVRNGAPCACDWSPWPEILM